MGPTRQAYDHATKVDLKPVKLTNTHGLHVRDALSSAPDQVCGRAGDAAGGLRRLLDAAGEELHRQPVGKVRSGDVLHALPGPWATCRAALRHESAMMRRRLASRAVVYGSKASERRHRMPHLGQPASTALRPLAGASFAPRSARREKPFVPPTRMPCGARCAPATCSLIAGSSKALHRHQVPDAVDWSHATLFVGDACRTMDGGEPHSLIEVTPVDGCVAVPLAKYELLSHADLPAGSGLTNSDREDVVRFMVSRIGLQYDMRNIFDLARYLLPTPPVPTQVAQAHDRARLRGSRRARSARRLIAEAFGRVGYPILPRVDTPSTTGRRASATFDAPGNPAYPRLQPLCAGRFRPLAILRNRQAYARAGLQLQGADVGTQALAARKRTKKN